MQEYEGDYVHDKKHGHGRYSWPSGAYFCGYFEYDLREGTGVYVSPAGERFEVINFDRESPLSTILVHTSLRNSK